MKVFCIGYNKTGTTSLSNFFRDNGFLVAPQTPFEYNLNSYFSKNYSTFVDMIKEDYHGYSFFQDVPFSLPFFYKTLDREFENSKFILTVRNSEDDWYNSLIRFHKKKFTNFLNPQKIMYVYEGWMSKILEKAYGTPLYDLYNPQILKKSYLDHISDVKLYFKNNPNKLLILNLEKNEVKNLESFLDTKFTLDKFPKINTSV